MKPRGPLMIEHRLIEKMFGQSQKEVIKMKNNKIVDPLFIDTIVDFIRTYADRTHHGKEEDILFVKLKTKNLNKKDNTMMNDLINEHRYARSLVVALVDAKNKYISGDKSCLPVIIEKLETLINFYSEHIKKEDLEFFPNTELYFTKEELDTMLSDFWEFDRKMIHERYQKVFETLSKK
ncbi:MAG: hemerythrin domain-containing protein [Thermodesulfobacteriota bacterium]|jgi:hemerythrin-like domain-containing protein|nr:MAG: hemerythrin domain-containing protein [Thermodesulfobacteriota bacterium]